VRRWQDCLKQRTSAKPPCRTWLKLIDGGCKLNRMLARARRHRVLAPFATNQKLNGKKHGKKHDSSGGDGGASASGSLTGNERPFLQSNLARDGGLIVHDMVGPREKGLTARMGAQGQLVCQMLRKGDIALAAK
jgi:hypothetical protein